MRVTRRDYLTGSALAFATLAARLPAATLVTDAANAHALIVSLAYPGTESALANTHNDGRLIAERLGQLKFGSVDHLLAADEAVFTRHLQRFIERLQPGALAFVYYAGHGVQVRGVNYLLLEDQRTFISMQSLVEALRAATDTVVLMLDACRTTPYGAIPVTPAAGPAKRQITSAEVQRLTKGTGAEQVTLVLKELQSGTPVQRVGSFEIQGTGVKIVFATDPQNTAADGLTPEAVNSPFALAMAKRLLERRSLDDVITLATGDVITVTEGEQSPWSQGSIGRPLYLAGPPVNRNPAKVPFQVPG